MRTLIQVIRNNIKYRNQIFELAKGNQKRTYKGSDLGIVWAFARPVSYSLVFYFAISMGFRGARNIEGITTPFFIWLMVGMFAWFYMSGMILGGAGCFRKYRGVIRNLTVDLDVIPTVTALSNLMIHFVIEIGLLIILAICGYGPTIYWLQIPIYMALMFVFWTFWSYCMGVVTLVSKDIYNLLKSISQAVFWLSAVIFDINSVDYPIIQKIFLFNPITYIVEGYRNSICRTVWIWEEPKKFICFVITTIVMAAIAMYFYKKLKKTVPDVI